MVKNSMKRVRHFLSASVALSLSAALSGCGGEASTNTDLASVDVVTPVEDWVMVWSDEFDSASIDSAKWSYEVNCDGGGNNEQQCYTDSADNSFVADGNLNIVALPAEEGAAKPYTSARMVTQYKADFKYGRFEMRAKLPQGQGSWPAFWMMPTDSVYGEWPKSGEIDIMEAVNLKVTDSEGNEEAYIHGTLHYGEAWPNNSSSGKGTLLPDGTNPADDFHTYAIEWQEGEIRWYVDNYLYQTQMMSEVRYSSTGAAQGLKHRGWFTEYFDLITGELETHWDSAPFDQEFFMILNLAVGGDWPSNVNNTGIDASAFENGQSYEVDYVRVYECASDPITGQGCETIRNGYKDEVSDDNPTGALVLGKAPNPPTPMVPGSSTPITIFADGINPDWPLWDCCGGTTPTVEIDDAQHGSVAEFSILDNNGTVLGFNSRDADAAYDASGMLTTGSLSFEVKVVTPPTSDTSWLVKIESAGGGNAGGTEWDTIIEPIVGEWTTFTFTIQELADAGLDVSAIDVIMVFPAWQTGEGAVYRVDNVEISEPSVSYPELVLFEDAINPSWPLWDCCAGSTPTEEMDDAEHGFVAEFSVANIAETVQGFFGRDNGSFDASALLTEGVIQFEMKVVTAPADGSPWLLKLEADGNTSNSGEIPLNTSKEGLDPVVGEWQTYTFDLLTLSDAGLDISAIDVVMVFPAWGTGLGAVYRIDNAKIFNPNANSGGPTGPRLVAFSDAENPQWPLWDCCAGSTPTVEMDDAQHGGVAEFSVAGNPETVQGFYSREAGTPFDASALLANGTISFEMKVVTPPADGSTWLFKVEAGDATSNSGEIPLNMSQEGLAPVTGEWQTYTFDLVTLLDAGLDISAIDVIMIFPAWGTGSGAVYRVDNVIIGNPSTSGGVDDAALTLYADTLNQEWPLWDCCAGSTPTEQIDNAEHGSVAEFSVLGSPNTVQGFYSRDLGTPFNAESIISGTFSFDMKIVSAPADGTQWIMKMEANGNTSDSGELNLNTSNEGVDPVAGEWQTYTFDVLTLLDAGLDISAIDVVMVFPAWGTGAGAVYRIDNAAFKP